MNANCRGQPQCSFAAEFFLARSVKICFGNAKRGDFDPSSHPMRSGYGRCQLSLRRIAHDCPLFPIVQSDGLCELKHHNHWN